MTRQRLKNRRPESTFKYVLKRDVGQYSALGWEDTDALGGTHHGEYSLLMEWRGEGEPVFPPETVR